MDPGGLQGTRVNLRALEKAFERSGFDFGVDFISQ